MSQPKKTRSELISRQLNRLFLPRVQMTIILFLTGLFGFLTSFILLKAGLSQMWLRYSLSISAAYGIFLVLLRIWIAIQNSEKIYDLNIDLPSFPDVGISPSTTDSVFGGSGDFQGGGAGGSWHSLSASPGSSTGGGGGSSSSGGIGFDLDLDELWFVVLAIVAIIGGLLASLYVVYIAPALLAEILVDALLLKGLYSRVKGIERKHWLQTAVRKTLLPAVLCALLFGAAGGALQMAAPDADSIGEVWKVLMTKH